MSDDHEHQPLDLKKLTTFAELLKFKKATEVAVIVFACLADPKCQQFFSQIRQGGALLASENPSCALGAIDVDDAPENVSTTFKIKAIPTTIFYRGGMETARVENCDMAALEKAIRSHLPSTTKLPDPDAVEKKATTSTSTIASKMLDDAQKQQQEQDDEENAKYSKDFTINNCYFGNIDAGTFVDVTDKIRSLFVGNPRHCQLTASKQFLGIDETKFTNTENNKLRIVLEKNGAGRTFTVVEGKTLLLGQELFFQYTEHSGRDGFDLKYTGGRSHDDDGDFSGQVNPYGGVPKFEVSSGGC